MFDMYEEPDAYMLVMEIVDGRELYKDIEARLESTVSVCVSESQGNTVPCGVWLTVFAPLHICQPNFLYSENEIRSIITTIFRAVQYCHQNGVLHRDLKVPTCPLLPTGLLSAPSRLACLANCAMKQPQNILIDSKRDIKVCVCVGSLCAGPHIRHPLLTSGVSVYACVGFVWLPAC